MVWYGMVWYGMVWYGIEGKDGRSEDAGSPSSLHDASTRYQADLSINLNNNHYIQLIQKGCPLQTL
jgi:hypothetical protein